MMKLFLFPAVLLLSCGLMAGVLNIREFGAKGDGVTDDTRAIQAAFAELVRSGGTLEFAPGTYAFSGLLRFSKLKNVKIDLGGATLVNWEQKGSFQFSDCDNLTISGGILTYREMPEAQQTRDQHPLYITGSRNVRVENVHILGSPFMGIAINGCRYVWVVNCKIERTMRDGLHFVFAQDIICSGNYITQTTDDALALIDYGHGNALRLERAVVTGNIIYNCRQGLVCVGGRDIIFANNHVERTTFSGCQITTNDRFNSVENGVCSAARVKVLGNRFIESGMDFKINGASIANSGQLTTGRAGIVISYICKEKGWNRDGDTYFTTVNYPVTAAGSKLTADIALADELFPGRKIQLVDDSGNIHPAEVGNSYRKEGRIEITLASGIAVPSGVTALKLSRIITDIEVIDNEVLNSHVNGIYTNGVYRLRVINNRVFNCNRANSKFTGQIVEILNGSEVDFLYNWIQENGTEKLHRTPLTITAKKCREIGTRIN